MKFSEDNVSVGDWVIPTDRYLRTIGRMYPVDVDKIEKLKVISVDSRYLHDGITAEHQDFDITFVINWDKISSVRSYCEDCQSRKLYYDNKEEFLCPHCQE